MSHKDNATDLFISYAHIDNLAMDESEEGWISRLHSSLNVRVQQILGGQISIWRDKKLNGNDEFGDAIIDGLEQSNLFICVVSPRYIGSEWCVRELNTFLQKNADEIDLGARMPVFKIVKTHVDIEQQPASVQGQLGYVFYDYDPETERRPDEFRQDTGNQKDSRYWSKLEDLADDIAQTLKKFHSQTSASNKRSKDIKGRVFLPIPTMEMDESYQVVKRYLLDNGYAVSPNTHPARALEDFQTETQASLANSDLAVHIIGARNGAVHEGAQLSDCQLQLSWAAQQANLAKLIWVPQQNQVDQRQQEFIDDLRSNEELLSNADLLERSLDEFISNLECYLHSYQEKLAAPSDAPSSSDLQSKGKIYLLYCEEDYDFIEELEDTFCENDFEIISPLFDGSAEEKAQDHLNNLAESDSVVVVYGTGTAHWVAACLREIEQQSEHRNTPFRLTGVFITGEETLEKRKFRVRRVPIVKSFANDKGPLDATNFLDAIKQSSALDDNSEQAQ